MQPPTIQENEAWAWYYTQRARQARLANQDNLAADYARQAQATRQEIAVQSFEEYMAEQEKAR